MLNSKMLCALAAGAALAAAPIVASAADVTPFKVEGRAPTAVKITIAGKAAVEVRQEVRVASRTVCKNAVSNRELAFYDVDWCSDATQRRALSRYAAIVRHNRGAQLAATELTLAVR